MARTDGTDRRLLDLEGILRIEPMTRSKEPEVMEMADALQGFETTLLSYKQRLEAELQAELEGENYPWLISGLTRQLAWLEAVHTFVDEELWEQMIILANMSQSLSHRRTRRMF
jgi:hypothetical protein